MRLFCAGRDKVDCHIIATAVYCALRVSSAPHAISSTSSSPSSIPKRTKRCSTRLAAPPDSSSPPTSTFLPTTPMTMETVSSRPTKKQDWQPTSKATTSRPTWYVSRWSTCTCTILSTRTSSNTTLSPARNAGTNTRTSSWPIRLLCRPREASAPTTAFQ